MNPDVVFRVGPQIGEFAVDAAAGEDGAVAAVLALVAQKDLVPEEY